MLRSHVPKEKYYFQFCFEIQGSERIHSDVTLRRIYLIVSFSVVHACTQTRQLGSISLADFSECTAEHYLTLPRGYY